MEPVGQGADRRDVLPDDRPPGRRHRARQARLRPHRPGAGPRAHRPGRVPARPAAGPRGRAGGRPVRPAARSPASAPCSSRRRRPRPGRLREQRPDGRRPDLRPRRGHGHRLGLRVPRRPGPARRHPPGRGPPVAGGPPLGHLADLADRRSRPRRDALRRRPDGPVHRHRRHPRARRRSCTRSSRSATTPGRARAGAGRSRRSKLGLHHALEGLRFIQTKPILLGAISLDLFAVLFGGAVALLPAIAEERLGVGVGRLRLAAGRRRHRRRRGHAGPDPAARRPPRRPHAAPGRRGVRRGHDRARR